MKKFAAPLFFIAIASRLTAAPIVSESKIVDVDHLRVHYTNYGKGDKPREFNAAVLKFLEQNQIGG